MPAPLPVRQVRLIFAVADVPRARAFYDRAFGWEVGAEVPVYVEYRLPGGMLLGLYRREGFACNTGQASVATPAGGLTATEIYLRVEDLGEAVARLTAAGARLLSPAAPREWGDEAAYFADPDGNVIAVARAPVPS